jgi:hypothetical protein
VETGLVSVWRDGGDLCRFPWSEHKSMITCKQRSSHPRKTSGGAWKFCWRGVVCIGAAEGKVALGRDPRNLRVEVVIWC